MIDLDIQIERASEVTRIAVAGDVDAYTAPSLRDAFDVVTAIGIAHVIVDLSAVTFLESTGVGVLAHAREQLRAEGRTLIVVGGNARMRRMLALAGLDEPLPAELVGLEQRLLAILP